MQLEQATAVLRPRSAWEAVDLGCSLARRQWGKLMTGWLSVALPLWAVIAVLLRDHPGWAGFAMWWTKPILPREPVFFMSRAPFGPAPRGRLRIAPPARPPACRRTVDERSLIVGPGRSTTWTNHIGGARR